MLHSRTYVIVVLLYVSIFVQSIDAEFEPPIVHALPDSCQNVNATTKQLTITIGWPVLIGCNNNFDSFYDLFAPTSSRCVITAENKILFDRALDDMDFMLPSNLGFKVSAVEAGQNGSIYTSYTILGSSCTAVSYVLIVKLPNARTCVNATFYSKDDNVMLPRGRLHYIPCMASNAPFYLQNETYQVKWYKDCQLVKTVEKQSDSPVMYGDVIDRYQISKVDFNSSIIGEFSCSVTYKGYEMFLTKVKTCVKYESSISIPYVQQISAPKLQAKIGDDVVLTCGGNGGLIGSLSHIIQWIRHFNGTEKIICNIYPDGSGNEAAEKKNQCNISSNEKEASKCFTNVQDAIEDEERGINKVNASLIIRDFAESDEGNYTCRQITPMGVSEASFEISQETWSPLIFILPSILGIILLILLVVVAVMCVTRGNCYVGRKGKVERKSSVNYSKKSSSDSRE